MRTAICFFPTYLRHLFSLLVIAMLPICVAGAVQPHITFSQLTSTSGCVFDGGNFYPSFDAANKHVAFTSSCDLVPGHNVDGNGELFIMNVDGSNLTQLTSSTGGIGVFHSKIDLMGQRIVFASDRDLVPGGNGDGNAEIFIINVNGTGLAQLTHTTGGNQVCGVPGNSHPQFDPKAHKIIFDSDRDLVSGGNTDGNDEVFTMNPNGTGVTQITHTTGGCGCGEGNLDLTGTKVLFESDRDLVTGGNSDGNYELFTMGIDGSNIVQLTNTVNPNGIGSVAPRWTPDTKTIVFRGDGADNFQLFRMNGDGSNLVQMTWQPGGFGSAPWGLSTDGKTIAVESDRDLVPGGNADGNFEIYMVQTAP